MVPVDVRERLLDALRHRLSAAQEMLRRARSLGPRHALRRWRDDARYAVQHPARLAQITERIWRDAAREIGAEVVAATDNVFEFRRNGAAVRVHGQRTSFSTVSVVARASDKPLAYRLLQNAGLDVPPHVVVSSRNVEQAAMFLEHESPCIVKPARGSGGLGVIGCVRTVEQLREAMRRAGQSCERVIVERQLLGDHFRVLVLDGRVLDVVRRTKPHIVGDGRSTVEELIFREYERRLEVEGPSGLKPFAVDLDTLYTLEAQGLRLRSILPAGAVATVMTATNFGGPTESETYQGRLSPDLAVEVRTACATLGARLAGVDLVTPRPDLSLAEGGGAILEVNPVPALHHHYAVADPDSATRVAVPILLTLLDEAASRGTASVRP